MNGHILLPSSQDMVRFAVEVAGSEPAMDWREVAEWVRDNTIPMTGDKRQAIRLVREKFQDPEEIIDRLMDRWQEIARFIAS